jgi:hypothetical protein
VFLAARASAALCNAECSAITVSEACYACAAWTGKLRLHNKHPVRTPWQWPGSRRMTTKKRLEAAHGEGCWITAVQLCIV